MTELEPSAVISTTFVSLPEKGNFINEYPLLVQPNSTDPAPNSIVVDDSGRVWFVLQQTSTLAEFFPDNGSIREFRVPIQNNLSMVTWGIAVDSTSRMIWFTDQTSNSVWSFNYTIDSFKQYVLPTNKAGPFQIAVDANGNAWFTEFYADKLGEIDTQGKINEWNLSNTLFAEPAGIYIEQSASTSDASQKVWFTLSETREVGYFSNGKVQLFDLHNVTTSSLVGIAIDRSGNLWLTQHDTNFITEFNPNTGLLRTISTSVPPLEESLPYFIEVAPDGSVWFNEHWGNAITHFFPTNGTMIEYYIPSEVSSEGNVSGALTMAISSKGVPWFTEIYSGKVGTVNVGSSIPMSIFLNNNFNNSEIILRNNTLLQIKVTVMNPTRQPIGLRAAVGNATGNFDFQFSQSSADSAILNSVLTITGVSVSNGIYFLTVSAIDNGTIAVSQVVPIKVIL
ncbi:MAG: Vgb family protein [Nitrososphaerales archaeon]